MGTKEKNNKKCHEINSTFKMDDRGHNGDDTHRIGERMRKDGSFLQRVLLAVSGKEWGMSDTENWHIQ